MKKIMFTVALFLLLLSALYSRNYDDFEWDSENVILAEIEGYAKEGCERKCKTLAYQAAKTRVPFVVWTFAIKLYVEEHDISDALLKKMIKKYPKEILFSYDVLEVKYRERKKLAIIEIKIESEGLKKEITKQIEKIYKSVK